MLVLLAMVVMSCKLSFDTLNSIWTNPVNTLDENLKKASLPFATALEKTTVVFAKLSRNIDKKEFENIEQQILVLSEFFESVKNVFNSFKNGMQKLKPTNDEWDKYFQNIKMRIYPNNACAKYEELNEKIGILDAWLKKNQLNLLKKQWEHCKLNSESNSQDHETIPSLETQKEKIQPATVIETAGKSNDEEGFF